LILSTLQYLLNLFIIQFSPSTCYLLFSWARPSSLFFNILNLCSSLRDQTSHPNITDNIIVLHALIAGCLNMNFKCALTQISPIRRYKLGLITGLHNRI
jgi:hypothetical protein